MKYSIIIDGHHATYYNAIIYLCYNWKSVPFDRLHPFLLPHTRSSGNCQSVLCICELVVCLCVYVYVCVGVLF